MAQGPAGKVVFLVDGQVQAPFSPYKRSSIKETARQVRIGPGLRTPGRDKPTKGLPLDTWIHQSLERIGWKHWCGPCSWLGLTGSNPSITLQRLKSKVK